MLPKGYGYSLHSNNLGDISCCLEIRHEGDTIKRFKLDNMPQVFEELLTFLKSI
jgi:hypothetical protein